MKKQSKIENGQNVMDTSNFKILENSRKARISILIILCSVGFFIRYYFFPEDLPFLGDAVLPTSKYLDIGHFKKGFATHIIPKFIFTYQTIF